MGVETLIEQLKTIPDWRRGGRSVQYPLWLILLLCLLAVMSGYSSLRGWADFMHRHAPEVAARFGLTKARLPSYSTLHEMSQHVSPQQVAQVFRTWAHQAAPVEAGQAVSLDGKALGSTLQDCHGQGQNFVSVVSACVQQWDGVIGQLSFDNGKTSEIQAVRDLLAQLDLKGAWVTLDALHAQKKPSSRSTRVRTTTVLDSKPINRSS